MKAQPLIETENGYRECEPNEATHLMFNVPGPIPTRILPVMIGGTRDGTRNWTWNGSVDKPTIKPSVLSNDGQGNICHSFINDGKIQFLEDSTHELAGKTLNLLEVE